MKKFSIYLVLIFLVYSCNTHEEIDPINEDLIGQWRWIESCGGITGDCWSPEDDQNITMEFKEGAKYIRKNNGFIVSETSYSVELLFTTNEVNHYEVNTGSGTQFMFHFHNNNIRIDHGEGFSDYQKI
jgi:hypothetical protein